jgi:hypothetical protein
MSRRGDKLTRRKKNGELLLTARTCYGKAPDTSRQGLLSAPDFISFGRIEAAHGEA